MTTRVTDQRWWQAHERYLRYSSHALAAWQAANDKWTPPSLVRGLKERHARFMLLAEEARREAKGFES